MIPYSHSRRKGSQMNNITFDVAREEELMRLWDNLTDSRKGKELVPVTREGLSSDS